MTYSNIERIAPDIIRAVRDSDGVAVFVEQSHGEAWNIFMAGTFGPVPEYVAPPEPDPVIAWRGKAALTRQDFCLALYDNGVLPYEEAMRATKGDWPASFEPALAGLEDANRHRIVWAGAQTIGRTHPLILMLQAFSAENETIPPLTDEFVDQLFGWTDG